MVQALGSFRSELDSARREIDVLKATSDVKDKTVEELRKHVVNMNVKNNELHLKLAHDELNSKRDSTAKSSSASWSFVGSPPNSPEKVESPPPADMHSVMPTNNAESLQSELAASEAEMVRSIPNLMSPGTSSSLSNETLELQQLKIWMEDEIARNNRAAEEAVEKALRRTEAAEEALLKKNRTVEFGVEKIKEVQTVLTAPAKAGDIKIEVESNEDFPIDAKLR